MLRIAAIVSAIALAIFGFLVYVLLQQGDASYWEGEIAEFERRDISNPPTMNAVVFAGGGTIRLWDELEAQMAPLAIVNRGFGGAYAAHVAAFAPRIVLPYEPAAVVVAAGGDDLADVGGKSAESVAGDLEDVVNVIQPGGKGPHVYLMAITPAPMRAARWPNARAANEMIRDFAASRPGVTFIDVAAPLIDEQGNIRDEFFRWDGLTLNLEGYREIGRVVRRQLKADMPDRFGEPKPARAAPDEPAETLPPAP